MREEIHGRLVLDDRVAAGRLTLEDGWIAAVYLDDERTRDGDGDRDHGVDGDRNVALPLIAPGFVDVHVHGWGGHDATGDSDALSGMARALLRRGVTSFLPTAPSLSADELPRFADRVRSWIPTAPEDGAEPLGFNLEGPFLSPARKGAHDPKIIRTPADFGLAAVEPLLDGLRVMTIAPELPGALELIARLRDLGIAASLGHSSATYEEARAGYDAGGRTTTHIFNAMTGVDHRAPGLAVAALTDDDAYVELIADGLHVVPALWPLITRAKPVDRLLLVSDALSLAGMGDGRTTIGGLEVDVRDGRCTLAGTNTLAGSTIALDSAVRNLVAHGVALPAAVAAASRNPLALLGETDRGRLAVGQRAHLVELDDTLHVGRVMRGGPWIDGAGVSRPSSPSRSPTSPAR